MMLNPTYSEHYGKVRKSAGWGGQVPGTFDERHHSRGYRQHEAKQALGRALHS